MDTLDTSKLTHSFSKGSREDFISNVKKWTLLDTQLKIVNEKTKKMRELKNSLTFEICNYINNNHLQKSIGINDGELRLYEKREYSPLSYSYIEECLRSIIQNPEHIEYIIQYLKDNREIKIIQDIKRTFSKDKN
jgi:hypothetical protein